MFCDVTTDTIEVSVAPGLPREDGNIVLTLRARGVSIDLRIFPGQLARLGNALMTLADSADGHFQRGHTDFVNVAFIRPGDHKSAGPPK